MAKENTVFLYGQVIIKPKVYANKDGELTQAYFAMKTIRRSSNSTQVLANKIYLDCPIVRTRNQDLIKAVYELRLHDMVMVKGVLCTAEVDKKNICPGCGKVNITQGNTVYINPLYIERRERGAELGADDDERLTRGLALLKERNEISNLIMVIGELCRDPDFYKDEQDHDYAQYQIAVNRRYRILEDAPTKKTDYPWVKTFGPQATEDTRRLQMHSQIYLNGALQTREITRHFTCESCGEVYNNSETVTEIVPYSTDYIKNCLLPEGEEEDSETENSPQGE